MPAYIADLRKRGRKRPPEVADVQVGDSRKAIFPIDNQRFTGQLAYFLGTAVGLPGRLDLASLADQVRFIARAHPASAWAHYQAGSYLGMAGRRLTRADLVNEGIAECWIAAQLRPAWDALQHPIALDTTVAPATFDAPEFALSADQVSARHLAHELLERLPLPRCASSSNAVDVNVRHSISPQMHCPSEVCGSCNSVHQARMFEGDGYSVCRRYAMREHAK